MTLSGQQNLEIEFYVKYVRLLSYRQAVEA
jgi:hypothetical protein